MTVRRGTWTYLALGLTAAAAAVLASWTALAVQFDNNVYDFLHRMNPAGRRHVEAALVAFDDRTLMDMGGMRNLRPMLARVLDALAAAPPSVVAVDLTLADAGPAEEDAALAASMRRIPKLVLACEMTGDGSAWQDPAPALRGGAALGHVHALPGPLDDVNRAIALERVVGRERRWALSVEAYRLWSGASQAEESPASVRLDGLEIPSRQDEGRPLLVRYRPSSDVEVVSVRELLNDKSRAAALKGRVAFIGVTALSAVKDRLFTPVSPLNQNRPSPGVEIHLQAFETLASGELMRRESGSMAALLALLTGLLMAAAYAWLRTRWASVAAGAVLTLVHVMPWAMFKQQVVAAPFGPVAAAWLSFLACASYRFFVVRRQLATSEAKTERYQQAFHFVAHEMRTPLTAIQGSSELISRYNLPEEKRKEIGQMINAESKRLAKMISTFLDVERLNAGQAEMKVGDVAVGELVDACAARARPLADRKRITLTSETSEGLSLRGDRELLEYALYNLITNAIKYSPEGSAVRVAARNDGQRVSLAVSDQGMGMTQDEVKNLFRKFYRTERAQKAGIQGTGIGLSIVGQIVELHKGKVTVESAPDAGSTFTVVL